MNCYKWRRKLLIRVIFTTTLLAIYCNAAPPTSSPNVTTTTTTPTITPTTTTTTASPSLKSLLVPEVDQASVIVPDATVTKIRKNPLLLEIDERYAKCGGVDIREISIVQLQDLFASGQLSVVELTQCYLRRIDRMDPTLKVVIETNPDAVNDALRLDEELQLGNSRGPMHGIPVLLKDGIGTADLMENTAGSPALVGLRPRQDANVVMALRKAGAVILGKANLSEFYFFRGTNIPNGWSGRGGQSRNAYNLNVTPEGSSSGSAVATSANLCVGALGTETDGSMIGPSGLAGVCAMKPTFGLVSVDGVIPVSRNQDHVGPMARTVTDLSIMLDAIIPVANRPSEHPHSYVQNLMLNNDDSSFSRPFRVGVFRYPFWDTSVINSTHLQEQMPQLEDFLLALKRSSNFQILDPVEISENELFNEISKTKEFMMLHHDFKRDLNEYLANDVIYSNRNSVVPATLGAIIRYNEEHPIPEGYNQDLLMKSESTDANTLLLNQYYLHARDSNRAAAKQFLDSVLEKYTLDAIVTPSEPRAEGISEESMEDFPTFGLSVACIAGYPSINIPAGIGKDEVPFGITFVGKAYSEPRLLKLAYSAEQLTMQRRAPRFMI